jgi:4-amino-4-deoxy-L-arabinose transferase-like glycosyltransferase
MMWRGRFAARVGLGLLALVGIGFALRVWGIERYGLWIDEITTAQCLELPLRRVLDCYWVQVGSPMVFVATNLVYTLFGRMPLPAPEWMVRLPEVLAGTLTIPAAWLAAREWLGARGAWLNAVLWTFAPTAVAYSQEARMYAWLMLFSNLLRWLPNTRMSCVLNVGAR